MCALASPVLCGVYDSNGDLIHEYSSDKNASDSLVSLLLDISSSHEIDTIIYANGPGSYMGLKVSYVILKSYSVVKNCKFLAVSGFDLNGGGAVRATKTMSFVKEPISQNIDLKTNIDTIDDVFFDDGEYMVRLANVEASEFKLPLNLNTLQTSADTAPRYFTQAV